jgi:hypothetical protein
LEGYLTNFFNEMDDGKKAARDSLRRDILAAINKAHYTQGVSRDVATALACEAVVECYSRVGGRDEGSVAQTLRWMADQLESQPAENGDEDGLVYE